MYLHTREATWIPIYPKQECHGKNRRSSIVHNQLKLRCNHQFVLQIEMMTIYVQGKISAKNYLGLWNQLLKHLVQQSFSLWQHLLLLMVDRGNLLPYSKHQQFHLRLRCKLHWHILNLIRRWLYCGKLRTTIQYTKMRSMRLYIIYRMFSNVNSPY